MQSLEFFSSFLLLWWISSFNFVFLFSSQSFHLPYQDFVFSSFAKLGSSFLSVISAVLHLEETILSLSQYSLSAANTWPSLFVYFFLYWCKPFLSDIILLQPDSYYLYLDPLVMNLVNLLANKKGS